MNVTTPPIGRQIERDLRFGRKARDHLVLGRCELAVRAVGDLERVDQIAGRLELIQHDLRGDTETGVGGLIVKDGRIGAICGRGHAIRRHAVGRQQRHASDDIRRVVVIHRAADQQISRLEFDAVVVGKRARGAWDGR